MKTLISSSGFFASVKYDAAAVKQMRSHQQSLRDDIAAEIADSVDYVIQAKRTQTGRRITDIAHVQGFSREAKCFVLETVFPTLQESSLSTH